MDMREVRADDVTIVDLAGRIDSTTAPQLAERLGKLIAAGQSHLIVDMDAVDYISSAGFRALLIVDRIATRAAGSLAVCRPSPQVRKLFDIASFGELVPVHDARPAAGI